MIILINDLLPEHLEQKKRMQFLVANGIMKLKFCPWE